MKIDVEGAELSVLKGAEQTIRRFKPPILLELNSKTAAVFGYDPLDVPRLLLGYHPSYRLRLVGHYDATEKTLAQLEFEGLRDGMLLLE
jgi:hypothetical protein